MMRNKILFFSYFFFVSGCIINSTYANPFSVQSQEKKDYGIQEEKRPYTKPKDRSYLPKNTKVSPKPSIEKSRIDSVSKKVIKHR